MSKNSHVPIRNSTAEITGRLRRRFTSFPANAPIITEYNGLTAKNESLFGQVFYCIKVET